MAGSFSIMPEVFFDVVGIVTLVGVVLFSGVIVNYVCDLIDGAKDKD